MSITWVVVASTVNAKIYALGKTQGQLELLQDFPHPKGREKASELAPDKRGQFEDTMHGSAQSFEHTDPKVIENMHFAHTIMAACEAGRNAHLFDRLILVAEPRFYGMLREASNKHVLDLVYRNIQKDYINLSAKELYPIVSALPE